MLAKTWKKICLVIVIVACLCNIISKFVYKMSFDKAVRKYQEEYIQNETTNTNK